MEKHGLWRIPESQPTKTEEEGVQGSARRELTAEG